MDPKVNEDALEDGLSKLERARSWSPRVVSKLEHDIRSAEDAGLFRMNPLQWATDRGVDERVRYAPARMNWRPRYTTTPVA